MRLAFALVLIAVLASIACGNVIARKYEYEEEIFLALDGSATVYVNASVPALVALRGVALPLDPRARLDRLVVRDLYETPVSHVASVTTSRREGRRYVHLRIDRRRHPPPRRSAAVCVVARTAIASRTGSSSSSRRCGPPPVRTSAMSDGMAPSWSRFACTCRAR